MDLVKLHLCGSRVNIPVNLVKIILVAPLSFLWFALNFQCPVIKNLCSSSSVGLQQTNTSRNYSSSNSVTSCLHMQPEIPLYCHKCLVCRMMK